MRRRVMRENGLVAEAEPTVLIRTNRDGHGGALNPNWGGGPATIACEQCGAPVTAHKRNGGKQARFCSSECYGKWMHEHPEEVKSKRLSLDWDERPAVRSRHVVPAGSGALRMQHRGREGEPAQAGNPAVPPAAIVLPAASMPRRPSRFGSQIVT